VRTSLGRRGCGGGGGGEAGDCSIDQESDKRHEESGEYDTQEPMRTDRVDHLFLRSVVHSQLSKEQAWRQWQDKARRSPITHGLSCLEPPPQGLSESSGGYYLLASTHSVLAPSPELGARGRSDRSNGKAGACVSRKEPCDQSLRTCPSLGPCIWAGATLYSRAPLLSRYARPCSCSASLCA